MVNSAYIADEIIRGEQESHSLAVFLAGSGCGAGVVAGSAVDKSRRWDEILVLFRFALDEQAALI